jgi:hypothetical protein
VGGVADRTLAAQNIASLFMTEAAICARDRRGDFAFAAGHTRRRDLAQPDGFAGDCGQNALTTPRLSAAPVPKRERTIG